mmetsp:Transcript_27435/g.66626  ORF Transcript_27435/g.66626 Transcript_27435/m.66626 type:complete len:465 (-) Transcript_27435:90-1484(-)|eukprot:CAMPEP_0113639406 /NCGR_PEP_ID=MMETSP0017_2-20120614/20670_1 /TAXON_ID=2856 /ORGANISM="Cylindrotheca closterium" /LENGTH=464 /DNA_ID=CAMNT_0000550613 /DNA_START=143 /DNA_END=1537 /DNA_ORIENTATION=- /assembly_acc=CAM_ASM_000147
MDMRQQLTITLWNEEDEEEVMELEEGTGEIPSKFNFMKIEWYAIMSNDGKVTRLLRLLNEDRRWDEVNIIDQCRRFVYLSDGPDEETRCEAFPSVLGLIMLRTKKLEIDIQDADDSFCRCLMSGLKSPNGMQELNFLDPQLEETNARLIAEGLATSTCLKTFHLELPPPVDGTWADDEWEVDVLGIVTDAIKRNPKGLENLKVHAPMTQQALMNTTGYLKDENCALLHLELSDLVFRDCLFFCRSVRNEKLRSLSLAAAKAVDKLHDCFPCLTTLKLTQDTLNDLSVFDPYLLGESATLQHFELHAVTFREEAVIQFSSKLPNMKTLRSLVLANVRFHDSMPPMTSLLKAVLNSKFLESLKLGGKSKELRIVLRPYQNMALSQLNYNCIRRQLEGSKSVNLPSNIKLWPRILKRCTTMLVEEIDDDYDYDYGYAERRVESIRRRADAVFRVLKDHAHIFDIMRG